MPQGRLHTCAGVRLLELHRGSLWNHSVCIAFASAGVQRPAYTPRRRPSPTTGHYPSEASDSQGSAGQQCRNRDQWHRRKRHTDRAPSGGHPTRIFLRWHRDWNFKSRNGRSAGGNVRPPLAARTRAGTYRPPRPDQSLAVTGSVPISPPHVRLSEPEEACFPQMQRTHYQLAKTQE